MCILCTLSKTKGTVRDILYENEVAAQDEVIRQHGMAFLQSANETSQLATRYITMLQRILGNPTEDNHDGSLEGPSSSSLISNDLPVNEFQFPTSLSEDAFVLGSGAIYSDTMLDLNFTGNDQAFYGLGFPVDCFPDSGAEHFPG